MEGLTEKMSKEEVSEIRFWEDFRYAFQGMDYRKGDHKIKRKWCSKNI